MDLVSRVQRLPIGRFHYNLLGIVGLGWMFDAMDTGIIAFIMTKLVHDWSLTPVESGWIVSIGFVGMAIGAVFSGALADRFGRKNVFASTMVLYSIATALCAFAPNLTVLLVCRFLVGLGLGGQLPVAPFSGWLLSGRFPLPGNQYPAHQRQAVPPPWCRSC